MHHPHQLPHLPLLLIHPVLFHRQGHTTLQSYVELTVVCPVRLYLNWLLRAVLLLKVVQLHQGLLLQELLQPGKGTRSKGKEGNLKTRDHEG